MAEDKKIPIKIEISSKIDQAGEKQTVDQQAKGDLLVNDDGSWTVLYEEQKRLVRLEVAASKQRIVYFGENSTHIVYDQSLESADSVYANQYGSIPLSVKTEKVLFQQKNGTGDIKIVYEIFQADKSAGKFDLSLHFSPSVSTID